MRFPFKRFKIVEQFAVVLVIAVIIPLFIVSIIVNNINQQAIRKELRQSAILTADIFAQRINSIYSLTHRDLDGVVLAIKHIPALSAKKLYLKELEAKSKTFKDFVIEKKQSSIDNKHLVLSDTQEILAKVEISPTEVVKIIYDANFLEKTLMKNFEFDKRQFYILDGNGRLLMAHNFNEEDFLKTFSLLPKNLEIEKAQIFGNIKNQPLVYYKMQEPDVLILINTTDKVTKTTITKASMRIFLSFIIAVCSILFVVGLYLYYLYINMRQLLKGLMAVTKGNYKRKIRLLVSIFTPHEIVFITSEFNKMVTEINKSYKELHQKNIELKQLDAFRSNLIDTVSHEFRTPLTSIQGYTSRLLRQDIQIDEQTKNKSLMIIKRQSERLSRMVEDLLAIPDIESSRLKINLEPVSVSEIFEIATSALSNPEDNRFNIAIQEGVDCVLANKDKLEQVIMNILENALKYSDEDSIINLTARKNKNYIIISSENKSDYIPKPVLNRLFEKFTRVDDKTTRETRGTGLGLYIVKGIIKAMNGDVNIYSSEDRTFKIEFKLKEYIDE